MFIADTWYEIVFPPLVTLAVVALAAVLLWLARGKLAEFVRELGIQKVSALGVDLQFVQHQTQVAYADKKELPPPSQEDLTTVRDAARFLVPLVAQSRLLWVDDNPGGNSAERAILLAWEVDVQTARTTDEAIDELRDPEQTFDLVLSDWRRPEDSDSSPAGLDLLERMSESDPPLEERVIFYHGVVEASERTLRRRRARDACAVGATDNPAELLRWTLIELARVAIDRPRPVQLERRERGASAARDVGT